MRKAKRAAARRGRHLRVMFADEARFCQIAWNCDPTMMGEAIEHGGGYGMLPGLPERPVAKVCQAGHPLVLDGAPNHRCSGLVLPGNISLLFLPPYSPELNPKENLWDEIREKLFKNYALKSIDAVRDKLKQAIFYIERIPETVKSITSFPYIRKSF